MTAQVTYYYTRHPILGIITAETYCDGTCGYPCDGHEAPGSEHRCRYCYWKPCRCTEMEQTHNHNQTLTKEAEEQNIG